MKRRLWRGGCLRRGRSPGAVSHVVLRPRRLFRRHRLCDLARRRQLDQVESPGLPVPVIEHGPAGSADSFSAADPTVLRDGRRGRCGTGDDSSKRIAYATSLDGVTWAKGGKVIAPEDPGVSANIEFGAFAPTVWKTPTGYAMLTGRKLVGGGVFQTKVMGSSSADGVSWSGRVRPESLRFEHELRLLEPQLARAAPGLAALHKLYYSKRSTPTTTSTRIGLATSNNGSSFNKVDGSQTGDAVLNVGSLGTAFDARQASGLSVAAPSGATPKLVGFYWGTRGSDFGRDSERRPRPTEPAGRRSPSWCRTAARSSSSAIPRRSTTAASATHTCSTTRPRSTCTSRR